MTQKTSVGGAALSETQLSRLIENTNQELKRKLEIEKQLEQLLPELDGVVFFHMKKVLEECDKQVEFLSRVIQQYQSYLT